MKIILYSVCAALILSPIIQPGITLAANYAVYPPYDPDAIGPGGESVATSSSADMSAANTIDPDTPDTTGSATIAPADTSPDAADYADTGGVPNSTLTISSFIPDGCLPVLPLTVAEPVVEVKDKYSYDDMAADLAALSEKYPQYMSYTGIGTTADNRQIYEAIVGNASSDTQILITASMHAREYITTLLVMKQLEYILYYADTGAFDGKRISDWLSEVCIRFIPMVNPDGVSISQFGVAGIGSDTLRQTLNQAYINDYTSGRTRLGFGSYLTRWKANANGVNINDNFAVINPKVGQSPTLPSSEEYYGTPGSEAETQALQKLVDDQHFKAVLNYHATGSLIYWNFAENQLVEHTRDLSNNIWALTGYTLTTTGVEGGSFKGYLGSLASPVTNLTIEVGRSSAPVNILEFDTIWRENIFVPFYTMKWAATKGK